MRTRRLAPLLIILVLLTQIAPAYAVPQYRFTMNFTFENKGSEPVALNREDVAIPLFIQNQWQVVKITSAAPPLGQEYSDEDGNRMVGPGIPMTVPPGAKYNYTVVYEIESRDKPKPQIDPSKAGSRSDIPPNLVAEYTSSSNTFPANDTRIAELAAGLTRNEPAVLGKVIRLIKWLNANITYDNYEVPRFAGETFEERKGDCDDQSILLIAMLRSLDIPSYLEVGVVFDKGIENKETVWDGHLRIDEAAVGWHGWVMVYVPPWGWLPVDLTLVRTQDPLEAVRNAPEYGGNLVTSYKVVNQDYVGNGRASRQRIIDSTIYVSSVNSAAYLTEPSWPNSTVLVLAAALGGAAVAMFYIAKRRRGQ
ncbi:MAG: transglutaminase family protein [Candidatus Bathyarchaeia archaeon]